jgi:2Fe-2S ferredoxin
MPTVVFERTRYQVELPDGGRIVDVCDAHPFAGIPFSCRAANCGTCRLEVTAGLELCEPPDDDEAELLAYLHEGPTRRLGCRLAIKPGPGHVRLRVTL